MNALFARKKLFLEDHRWHTVPWALEPASSKRPQSHLLDIFVTIPGLLEEERRLSDEGDEEELPQNNGIDSRETIVIICNRSGTENGGSHLNTIA